MAKKRKSMFGVNTYIKKTKRKLKRHKKRLKILRLLDRRSLLNRKPTVSKRKERWLYTQIAKVKEKLDSNGGRAEKDRSGIIIIISVRKSKPGVINNI
jgi:hypothetical protein